MSAPIDVAPRPHETWEAHVTKERYNIETTGVTGLGDPIVVVREWTGPGVKGPPMPIRVVDLLGYCNKVEE